MDLMVRCFRTVRPDHPGFERFLPDLYQPTDESMGCNFILRIAGRIVACVGLFPISLRLREIQLRIAGIGGVCTDPAHRGQGLMSRLLEHVKAEMVRQGYALSWLSGLRDRYAHFGWEKAGSDLQVRIRVPVATDERWLVSRQSPPSAVRSFFEAHEQLSIRGLCDEATFGLKLRRFKMELLEAERDGRRAYLVLNTDKPWIAEWGGDPEGVEALLQLPVFAEQEWFARLPAEEDEYSGIFRSCGESMGPVTDNLAVFDLPALLTGYESYLRTVWPRGKTLSLAMKPSHVTAIHVAIAGGKVYRESAHPDAALELDALTMVQLLFGPDKPSVLLNLPPTMDWLDEVFPLPFYMPSLWRV